MIFVFRLFVYLYTVSQVKRGHFSFRNNFYSCKAIRKIFEARNFAHFSASTDIQNCPPHLNYTKTKVAPFYLGHGVYL